MKCKETGKDAMEMRDAVRGVDTTELLQLVTFRIGNEEFGVNILNVQEINRLVDITAVPEAPEYVEGIINLRGKVLPVINLRKRFGMEARANDQHTRIIVAELKGRTVGFRVDAVKEVLRISSDDFEPPPEITTGSRAGFFTSVAKLGDKLLILIDLERVLSSDERYEFSGVGENNIETIKIGAEHAMVS